MPRAATALFLTGVLAAVTACHAQARNDEPHVFLLIGDGMGYSCEVAASRYRYGNDEGLAWDTFPFRAWVSTWDVTSYTMRANAAGAASYDEASAEPLVGYDPASGGAAPWPAAAEPTGAPAYLLAAATDSAAAATAMATGAKTDSGNIAWARGDPADGSLETIAELMRVRLGASIGIVTTVPFDHATPAAFAAHSTGRGDYASIAEQMIHSGTCDFIIGGGHPTWCGTYFGASALDSLRASGDWLLVERVAGAEGGDTLASAAGALSAGMGLFGLFGGTDGSFETPVPAYAPGFPAFAPNAENPSLARAVEIAAEALTRSGGAFLLVAEQGDIDWANHANDYSRMIGALCSLDDAVRAVEAFVDRPGDDVTWENSLLIVSADHSTGFLRFEPSSAIMPMGSLPEAKGGGVFSFTGGTATYGSGGHANELVTLAAKGGAAAEAFGPYLGEGRPGTRILENTAIFSAIKAFAGLP